MMKLKFHVAEITTLESKVIISNILSELAESNYKVSNETPDMVEFYRTPWLWKFQIKNIVDRGIFKIYTSGNATYVQLTYYINILPVILCLIIFQYGLLYLQNEYCL